MTPPAPNTGEAGCRQIREGVVSAGARVVSGARYQERPVSRAERDVALPTALGALRA